jgi:hypothetical protein
MTKHFTNVTTAEGFGVASDDGFTLYDTARESIRAVARGGSEFFMCNVEGEQVAVFMAVAKERRERLGAGKPASIAAIVFADIRDPHAATVDAELGAGTTESIERWAFAAVVVALSTGSFDADHPRYLVRGLDSSTVEVTIGNDYDSQSWFGDAKIVDAT